MLRNCPNCSTKSIPTIKLALLNRDSSVACKSCGLKIGWAGLSKVLSTICIVLIIVVNSFLFRIKALSNLYLIVIGIIELLMFVLLFAKFAPLKIKE